MLGDVVREEEKVLDEDEDKDDGDGGSDRIETINPYFTKSKDATAVDMEDVDLSPRLPGAE